MTASSESRPRIARRKAKPHICPRCGKAGHPGGMSHHIKNCGKAQERFWRMVDKSAGPDGCWLWTGYLQPDGYGQFGLELRTRNVHSLSYIWANGPIPQGQQIRHTCHVRHCVNPAHMILGTHRENIDDMMAAGRQTKGERNPKATITEAAVLEIRATYRGEKGEQAVLARKYGVDPGVVHAIVRGRTWRHLL